VWAGDVTVVVPIDGRKRILLFTIEDTGIGIPRDRIGRLFKQFSQLDSSTTREFGGLVATKLPPKSRTYPYDSIARL
jgi:signal transduction histidine kinase